MRNERYRREVEGFAARVGEMATLIPITRAHGLEQTAVTRVASSADEVLEEPDLEINDGRDAVDAIGGAIALEGVGHTYPDGDTTGVEGIDLEIAPGETVAFVGSSGSGKSTLLNLVLGFIRPTAGRILLDGRDQAELDLRTVRRHMSVVPQESVLFEGSIRENVVYGLENVPDERVREALVDANAWEFVEGLDAGWDTVVGGAREGRARAPHAWPHDARRRAPPLDDPHGRSDRRARARPHRRAGVARGAPRPGRPLR
ncbi:MAG TPA: ABC transporter ATP-binding protein [Microbacterium sp.]|nr:ABC transporter ATP-binding protein [Microbacterium sp.]